MNTIRSILLQLEQVETANASLNATQFPGLSEQDAAYHLRLLQEEGFIKAQIHESRADDGKIGFAMAERLTWKGHDLLDEIRKSQPV